MWCIVHTDECSLVLGTATLEVSCKLDCTKLLSIDGVSLVFGYLSKRVDNSNLI
jgi:hypothetical protein